MSNWIVGAFALAFLAWLLGIGPRRPAPAPEDDLTTPTDLDELHLAELEVRDDGTAKPIGEALAGEEGADEDDWGPGTGGGALPGIL